MRRKFSDVWPIVHAERARLVDDLVGIDPDAWSTPSLCPGWDIHDVVAHLIDSATTTRLGFARRMVLARFDFDRDNAIGVARNKRDDPGDTLSALLAVVGSTRTPPAHPDTRLVEAFVHGEDIRRPLGISSHPPVDSVVDALGHQAKTAIAFGGGRDRIDGLRLIATDAEFVHGLDTDDDVSGRAVDLLLAVSGRVVPAGALTGTGAAALTAAT